MFYYEDIDCNPHLSLWRSETYVPPAELAWEKWLKEVEGGLAHELDGDQDKDGYSIDTAYDLYDGGLTVPEAVAEFQMLKVLAAKAK
jgi:hypothetical protein